MRNVKETQCLEPQVNTFRHKVSHKMGADAFARLPVSSVNMKNLFFPHVSCGGWRDFCYIILIRTLSPQKKLHFPSF